MQSGDGPGLWHTAKTELLAIAPTREETFFVDQETPVSRADKPAEIDDDSSSGRIDLSARRELIDRAVTDFQRGVDPEKSFKFLFDTFYDPTRSFLARRVSSTEDCLDLTQETFLRVYKGLEGYRGEAQFGTWVFRIALNTYLKWLRRLRADDKNSEASGGTDEQDSAWEDDELVAVDPSDDPLEQVLESERHQVLRGAIEELPLQMRRCTELRIYQDLSYREIAVVMRRSIETVKVHLFQARRKLKESFGEIDL